MTELQRKKHPETPESRATQVEHIIVVDGPNPTRALRRLKTRAPKGCHLRKRKSTQIFISTFKRKVHIHSNNFPRPGDPINYTHTQALEGYHTGDRWGVWQGGKTPARTRREHRPQGQLQ